MATTSRRPHNQDNAPKVRRWKTGPAPLPPEKKRHVISVSIAYQSIQLLRRWTTELDCTPGAIIDALILDAHTAEVRKIPPAGPTDGAGTGGDIARPDRPITIRPPTRIRRGLPPPRPKKFRKPRGKKQLPT